MPITGQENLAHSSTAWETFSTPTGRASRDGQLARAPNTPGVLAWYYKRLLMADKACTAPLECLRTCSSLPVFLTELHYPVTGCGDEVTGDGDGHTDKVRYKEGLCIV